MAFEPRKQSMAWMKTDYSKHTHFLTDDKMAAAAFWARKEVWVRPRLKISRTNNLPHINPVLHQRSSPDRKWSNTVTFLSVYFILSYFIFHFYFISYFLTFDLLQFIKHEKSTRKQITNKQTHILKYSHNSIDNGK